MAAFIPLLTAIAAPLMEKALGGGGKEGQWGSTYNEGQLGGLDKIMQQIQQMQGNPQDISQNQNYQQGQGWLQDLYNDPEFFNKFEAPIQRQFQEQTVPDLANRFGGMGSHGSFGTGFRNQLAREGSNLSTNIAALRGGMQQQGVNQSLGYAQQPFQNLMQLYQQALQPTQNVYQPATAGFMGPISAGFASGASQGFGQQWGQNMSNGGGGMFGGQSNPSQNVSLGGGYDRQFRQEGLPGY